MASDVTNVDEEAYSRWAEKMGMVSDPDSPTEENLVRLFSNTMRETDIHARANGFLEIANMALAMADKTLGCQVPVAKCLVLNPH